MRKIIDHPLYISHPSLLHTALKAQHDMFELYTSTDSRAVKETLTERIFVEGGSTTLLDLGSKDAGRGLINDNLSRLERNQKRQVSFHDTVRNYYHLTKSPPLKSMDQSPEPGKMFPSRKTSGLPDPVKISQTLPNRWPGQIVSTRINTFVNC